jgi:hypothetical protein
MTRIHVITRMSSAISLDCLRFGLGDNKASHLHFLGKSISERSSAPFLNSVRFDVVNSVSWLYKA